jgi:hypothetical protein
MKSGLDNITRTALNEVASGLLEMFQTCVEELILVAREQR